MRFLPLHRHLLIFLCGLWWSMVGATSIASEPTQVLQPLDWLQRMSESPHRYSYVGTFILQRGERIDTLRVVHASESGGYRERLQTLTGMHREVIRSVDPAPFQSTHAFTNTLQSPMVSPADTTFDHGSSLRPLLQRAFEHYHLHMPGEDRIAGFPCRILQADAGDAYRYSHRYCLDLETGLPLLSELLDPNGRLLERMIFTELEFLDTIAEEELRAQNRHARYIDISRLETSALHTEEAQGLQRLWKVEELPPGFSIVLATLRSLEKDAVPVRHYVLSDGLATVSVYVDVSGRTTPAFDGATRYGATYAMARNQGGQQVTIVGEVPWITLEHIANATRLPGQDHAH
jgi:sigma-E factor negative regulatory protein RseB